MYYEKQALVERYEHELTSERQKVEEYLKKEESRYDAFQEQCEWESKLEKLKNKNFEEIEVIKKEMSERSKAFERERGTLVDSFNTEREELLRRLKDQKKTYEREKEITTHQCYMDLLVRTETERMKEEFEREKHALLENWDQEKTNMRVEYERRLKMERDDFQNSLERQQNETVVLKRVKSQLEAKIHEIERKHVEEKHKLSLVFSDVKRGLQEDYHTRLEEVKKTFLEEMAEMTKQKIVEEEEKLRKERQAIEERVREELSARASCKSSDREKHVQQAFYVLEQERNAFREKALELERKLVSQKELFKKDRDLITEQCKREKEDLQRKLVHEKEMLKVAYDATLSELRRVKEEKESTVQSTERETKVLRCLHENGTNNLEKYGKDLVERIQDDHRSTLHAMEKSHERTVCDPREKVSGAEQKIKKIEDGWKSDRDKMERQREEGRTETEQNTGNSRKEVRRSIEFQKRLEEEAQEGNLASYITEVSKLRQEKKILEREITQQQIIRGSLGREINAPRKDFSCHVQADAHDRQLSQNKSYLEHEIQELRDETKQLRRGTPSLKGDSPRVRVKDWAEERMISREDRSTSMMATQSYAISRYGSYSATGTTVSFFT